MKTKSLKTVNVIECNNEVILQLKSFNDDEKGNNAAENLFTELLMKKYPDSKRAEFLGLDYYLEEGVYSRGDGYYIYLVHSN